jgi:hypothetical protein
MRRIKERGGKRERRERRERREIAITFFICLTGSAVEPWRRSALGLISTSEDGVEEEEDEEEEEEEGGAGMAVLVRSLLPLRMYGRTTRMRKTFVWQAGKWPLSH